MRQLRPPTGEAYPLLDRVNSSHRNGSYGVFGARETRDDAANEFANALEYGDDEIRHWNERLRVLEIDLNRSLLPASATDTSRRYRRYSRSDGASRSADRDLLQRDRDPRDRDSERFIPFQRIRSQPSNNGPIGTSNEREREGSESLQHAIMMRNLHRDQPFRRRGQLDEIISQALDAEILHPHHDVGNRDMSPRTSARNNPNRHAMVIGGPATEDVDLDVLSDRIQRELEHEPLLPPPVPPRHGYRTNQRVNGFQGRLRAPRTRTVSLDEFYIPLTDSHERETDVRPTTRGRHGSRDDDHDDQPASGPRQSI